MMWQWRCIVSETTLCIERSLSITLRVGLGLLNKTLTICGKLCLRTRIKKHSKRRESESILLSFNSTDY